MTTSEWLDKLAPRAWAIVAAGTCACYGGIHAMAGNPTGAMGVADYLGWDFRAQSGAPIVNVPGCPTHPDNLSETLLYLLYQAAGAAPMIPLDNELRPTWLFGNSVHEGCDRAGYYEQGDFGKTYDSPKCSVKLGCCGAGREVQRAQARLDQRDRRLPERGRHLHRLHDAGLPGQVHAVHGRASRSQAFVDGRRHLRQGDHGAAQGHRRHDGRRAELAHAGLETHYRLQAELVTPWPRTTSSR
jgi:hypothetical protein